LKDTCYFHHNGVMVKGNHTHKQYIVQNPQFYVSTSGMNTTWLDSSNNGGHSWYCTNTGGVLS